MSEQNEMLVAVKALSEQFEKNNVKSAADMIALKGDAKASVEKIQADIDKQEVKNQKLIGELAAERKERADVEERLAGLEAKASRMPCGSDLNVISAEVKAFQKFLAVGDRALSAEEFKTLNTNVATEGGVLVPDAYDSQILKNITEVSAIRSVSRVRQTTAMQYRQPRRTSNLTASWAGELATRGVTQQVYGEEIINVNALTAIVPLSNQVITSAAFNMEAEVNADVAEQFAQAEGLAFVSGDGSNKPDGILSDTRVGGITSEADNTLTVKDFIDLSGNLKTGYNPMFCLNRTTLAFVRGLKATDGNFLWGSGLAAGLPNTINGYSYIEANDMPDIADGTKPVIFGDFMRGYLVVDKTGLVSIRDPFTRKNEGIVELSFERCVGGKVVLPEAFKILTVQ